MTSTTILHTPDRICRYTEQGRHLCFPKTNHHPASLFVWAAYTNDNHALGLRRKKRQTHCARKWETAAMQRVTSFLPTWDRTKSSSKKGFDKAYAVVDKREFCSSVGWLANKGKEIWSMDYFLESSFDLFGMQCSRIWKVNVKMLMRDSWSSYQSIVE